MSLASPGAVAAASRAALAAVRGTPPDPRPALGLLRSGMVSQAHGSTAVGLAHAVVHAAGRGGGTSPRPALEALRALARSGGLPTPSTAAAAVAACARTAVTRAGDADVDWARAGVRLARQAVGAGAPVTRDLISAILLCASGARDAHGADVALDLARAVDARVDLGARELVLAARARSRDPKAVRDTFTEFESRWRIAPPADAYNVLIRSAGRAGDADGVVAALAALRAAGLRPTTATLRAVVDGLAPDRIDLAADIVDEELERGALVGRAPMRPGAAAEFASVAAAVKAAGGATTDLRTPVLVDCHGLSKGGAAVAALQALRREAAGGRRGHGRARRRGREDTAARGIVLVVGRGPRAVYRPEDADAAGGLAASLTAFLSRLGVTAVQDPLNAGRLVIPPDVVATWAATDAAARSRSAAFNARAKAAAAVAGLSTSAVGLWAVWPALMG